MDINNTVNLRSNNKQSAEAVFLTQYRGILLRFWPLKLQLIINDLINMEGFIREVFI